MICPHCDQPVERLIALQTITEEWEVVLTDGQLDFNYSDTYHGGRPATTDICCSECEVPIDPDMALAMLQEQVTE